MRSRDPAVLVDQATHGDRGAAGRLLSLVERGGPAGREAARLTFGRSAATDLVVGITGAPGAGKSTLTDRLVAAIRGTGRRVGVLAVDPSSPFSGGAILGDRVRMGGHSGDDGVFIRSMATRGHLGGLSLAVPEAIRVLGAIGFTTVVVETVGVGQVEVEVAGAADTTVVVVNPGWGDSVQAAKAGLLEIADVFVVNKADRPGAEATRRDLETMLDLDPEMGEWRPPILLTAAAAGEGVDALWSALEAHQAQQQASGALEERRRRRLVDELDRILLRRLAADLRGLAGGATWEELSAAVAAHRIEPNDAADRLLAGLAADGATTGPLPSPGVTSQFVHVDRRPDGVALLTLDRPKANALSVDLLAELEVEVAALAVSPPGAVVVWGGPRIFAAGADIAGFGGPEDAAAYAAQFRRSFDALAALPRAVIAAVRGYALGGGCELAMACDLRVVASDARLGQPEILLGIIPGAGGTQRLPRLVGASRAKDLVLTGRQVDAEEALRIGLADRVAAPDETLDVALDLAAQLARGALVAQAGAKALIDGGLDGTLADGLGRETAAFVDVFRTEDAVTGVASFLEQGPGKATFVGR